MAISELPGRGLEWAKKGARSTALPAVVSLAAIMSPCSENGLIRSTNFPICTLDPLTKVQDIQLGRINGQKIVADVDGVIFESPDNAEPLRIDVSKAEAGRVMATPVGIQPIRFLGKEDGRDYEITTIGTFSSSTSAGVVIRVTAQCRP